MTWYLVYLLKLLLNDFSTQKSDENSKKLIPIIEEMLKFANKDIDDVKLASIITKLKSMSDNSCANFLLATLYKVMGTGFNHKLAFELYKRSADANYVHGIRGLALCYISGIGIEKTKATIEEGLRLLNEAVKLKDSFSMFELGEIYSEGKVVKKDMDKCLFLWLEASELDNPRASYCLSAEFEKHKKRLEEKVDYKTFEEIFVFLQKAFNLCEKASIHNNPEALYRMGQYYWAEKTFEQCLLKRDLNKSLEYLFKAMPLIQFEGDESALNIAQRQLEKVLLEINMNGEDKKERVNKSLTPSFSSKVKSSADKNEREFLNKIAVNESKFKEELDAMAGQLNAFKTSSTNLS